MLNRTEIAALADMIAEKVLAARPQVSRWLTLEEAMAYAKVKSKNTIRRWIQEGYIDANKRTGSWIIDRESIDDWFSSDGEY